MAIPERDRERVFGACEELESETIDLLAKLVKIPSENPGYKYEEKLYLEQGNTKLYGEPMTRGGETKVRHLVPGMRIYALAVMEWLGYE